MSYLETLRQRRKTPISAWHKLRTSLGTKKFDFYVAFEGEEDEEFFSIFLENRFPGKKFRPVICDGKGGVLALHSEVVKAYGSPQNVFFFLDADHDRFIGADEYPSQTFSTCGYAVENYIYDSDVVMSGVKKYFSLNGSDPLFDEIRDAFERDIRIFEEQSKSVMSYVIALRANDCDPNLDDINLHMICNLEDSGLKSKNRVCGRLLEAAGVDAIHYSEFAKYFRVVRTFHPHIFIRGKLVSQFVVNFCKRLSARFSDRSKINGKPLKAKVEFGKKNCVSLFADFVVEPDRLSAFFASMDEVLRSHQA
jgi:hypothetical protein